jgi:SWI/SNF-related matrix-associated actin-dependent regulator of chromatin subfamily A3
LQRHPDVRESALFSAPSGLLVDGFVVAKLDDRSGEILRALSEDCCIDVQITLLLPSQCSSKRVKSTRSCWRFCTVILYGPEFICDDVDTFCQTCDVYLQDPIGCERNVLYRNPHRMSSAEDRDRFTFELQTIDTEKAVVTKLQCSHFMDALVSSRLLFELETPSNLSTQLLP